MVANYLVVFAVAAIGTYAITFPVRMLATRIGMIKVPRERDVHKVPTAMGGGVAMIAAFLLAMVVASRLGGFHQVFSGSSEPLGVMLAAAVMFAVGFLDDIRPVTAPAKVAGQVLSSSMLYFLGVTMVFFKIPFAGVVVLSSNWLPLLTALWVVGMANAVNFIDGLDGLAAGVMAIAAGAFCIYGVRLIDLGRLPKDNIGPLVAAIACGVCVGFLPHNFNPAKIFMGDAGAMFLGLLMAVSTMVVGGRTTDVPGATYFFFAPLFIPFLILGVPMFDMVFAIVRRTASRSRISGADKNHLHHRLLRLGHGPRRSVVILWTWTALLSAFVLVPLYAKAFNPFIPFGAAVLGILLYTLLHPDIKSGAVDEEDEELPAAIEVPIIEDRFVQVAGSDLGVQASGVSDGEGGLIVSGAADLPDPLLVMVDTGSVVIRPSSRMHSKER